MSKPNSPFPQVMRPPMWLRVCLLGVATALSLACAYFVSKDAPSSWPVLTSGALATAAMLGAMDAAVCRVELTMDSMILVSNFKRREIPRTEFSRVTGEHGVPVALQTTSGEWVKLPMALPGGPPVAAVFRKWLSRP